MLAVAILSLIAIGPAHGDSSIRVVDRKLFLTGSSTPPQSLALSPIPPSGSVTAINLTRTELEFEYPNLIQTNTVTISSPLSFSLWLNSTSQTAITVDLTGALHDKLSSGGDLTLTNSTLSVTILPGPPRPYQLGFTEADRSLAVYSTVLVGIKVATTPGANVTMYWGSKFTQSYTILRLSGHQSLSPNTPFQVQDSSLHSSSTFDLNATYPDNIVYFQASVISAFGFRDIANVTLTVVDPLDRTVKTGPMNFHGDPNTPPYFYTSSWPYSSDATAGTYVVSIVIADDENATSFNLNGVATFALSRTSPIVRAALNVLPYVGVTGVVIAGGTLYYRRRKMKSYFAPFDYFNTLTGGELAGGTAVTIEGNTGSGKTMLAEQLMFEDLKRGKPCVFLATGDFPSNVRANMRSMGLDVTGYEQNGLLTFVDGYSAEAGQESREKIYVPSLGDLTTLGMKISSSLPEDSFKGGSLYIDSLTPLASKAKPENLVSFVQSIGARVKGLGGKAFFTLGPSVAPVVQKQLEEMADCVVQMEAFEEGGARKSRLRISKLRSRRHQQGWVIYTIEDGKGIIFYSKNPKP